MCGIPCTTCHCLCQHPTDTIQLLCVRPICSRFDTVPSRKRQWTSPATEISSKPTTTDDDRSQRETQQMFCPLYLDRPSLEPLLSSEFRRSTRLGMEKWSKWFQRQNDSLQQKLTLSLSSDSSFFVAPSSATSFRPSLAGSPLRQKLIKLNDELSQLVRAIFSTWWYNITQSK